MKMLASLVSFAALASLAHASDPALQPVKVQLEGDLVTGVGLITTIDGLAVNALGQTILKVDTDNAVTTADAVVLKNGLLFLQEGQPLLAPAGASYSSSGSLNLSDSGSSGLNFFLDGTAGTNDDSGIYLNDQLVLQEGTVSLSPAFTAGTKYIGFFSPKHNNNGQIFAMASVEDIAIATTVDRALVILHVGSLGQLLSETVIAKEGDVLPGQTMGVSDFGTGVHTYAFNDNGDVMYFADTTDASTIDGNIYVNQTLLAREGSPSPIAGRTWLSLGSSRMDLSNNSAHTIFQGQLSAPTTDDALIVVDGNKLVQEGDTLPDIAPFKFTSFGSGALRVTNDGDALWVGDWDDPDTTKDVGLFLNKKLIVQEGVTTINGLVVESVASVQDNLSLSSNGRYVLFEATLQGGLNGAFIIDRGPWLDLGGGDPGTNGQSRLLGSGKLITGQPVTLSLQNAYPNAAAALIIGVSVYGGQFMGGTLVPTPNIVLTGLPVDANGNLQLTAAWPAGLPPSFVLISQFFYADPGASYGVAGSNAVLGASP